MAVALWAFWLKPPDSNMTKKATQFALSVQSGLNNFESSDNAARRAQDDC